VPIKQRLGTELLHARGSEEHWQSPSRSTKELDTLVRQLTNSASGVKFVAREKTRVSAMGEAEAQGCTNTDTDTSTELGTDAETETGTDTGADTETGVHRHTKRGRDQRTAGT
jgi:hypothetical protein